MAGGGREDAGPVQHAAALRVGRSEDEAADAKEADRRGAHRTRLERDEKVAAREPRPTEHPRGLPEREKFGVRGGVVQLLRAVSRAREHGALGREYRGADRHLAARARGARLRKRDLHRSHAPLLAADPPLVQRDPMPAPAPLIGVTLDAEPGGGYSPFPWYALRQNYASAILAAGGLPVGLPHEPEHATDYLERIAALVVTGGAFDVDPRLYGASERHASVHLKEKRTRAEMRLLEGALARDMPVLGICGGEQLLAVALGGSLIQHIPDAVAGALAHEQKNPRDQPGHEVGIEQGTDLARIVGAARMAVNSSHHQAVATPGDARVNARAADGVIEGIEVPGRRFCLGVQWHPEFLIDPGDQRIFAALIAACHS